MTRHVQFHAPFDYRWPSRAVSHFRPDGPKKGRYTVKAEVGEAAVAAGVATEIEKPAKRRRGAKRAKPDSVDVRNDAPDRDDASRNQLEPDADGGGAVLLPEPAGT